MRLEKEFYIYDYDFSDDKDIVVLANKKDNVTYHEETSIFKNIGRKVKLVLEVEEQMLTEEENEYLSDVIRPFTDKVEYIIKYNCYDKEFIRIKIKDDVDIALPQFEKGTMYKGMKLNKEYTLEELGL